MFLQEIVKAGPWKYDSAVNRTVWQGLPVPSTGTLTVGYIEDDGVFTPHPPVKRAMREAIEKLQKAGVRTVPIELPQVAEKYGQLFAWFKAAGSGVSHLNKREVLALTMRFPARSVNAQGDRRAIRYFSTENWPLYWQ